MAKTPTTVTHSMWPTSEQPVMLDTGCLGEWLCYLRLPFSSHSSRLFQTPFIIGKRQHLFLQTMRSKLY